jgi:hypothetical protein
MIVAAALSLVVAPAFADKPADVLGAAKPIKITAIPIDFDRDNPERKEFGKLIWRGGLNLFANSPFFGGYSALTIGPSGKTILAVSDAGIWLRGTIDYDGRKMKGVSNAVIGPLLGADGKPLRDDQERDSEGMTLIDGGPAAGTACISFEHHHRILTYPFAAQKFGPPTGSLSLRRAPSGSIQIVGLKQSRYSPLGLSKAPSSPSPRTSPTILEIFRAGSSGGRPPDHSPSNALEALTSPTPPRCQMAGSSCSNAASVTARE